MKTATANDNREWLQRRRANHHRALETLAQQVDCKTDGLKLWRQLRRLEKQTDAYSLQHCNGEIDGEKWDTIKEEVLTTLAKIFGGRVPDGVFINSDPRGYALKLDNEKVTIPEGMHTDWGGYGILAAEID